MEAEMGLNDEGDPANDYFERNDLTSWDPEATTTVIKWDKEEVVHTYDWYVRRWIADVRAAGAIPIISSSIVLNVWSADHRRFDGARWFYPIFARLTAKATNSTYVNHNFATKRHYEDVGFDVVQSYYPTRKLSFSLAISWLKIVQRATLFTFRPSVGRSPLFSGPELIR